MDKAEKEKLEASIAYTQDKLRKGLILDPEARSQLYRMIAYNRDRIEKEYKPEGKEEDS